MKATIAMLYYKKESEKYKKDTQQYRDKLKNYENSEETKNWNQYFIEEIENERKKNALKNSEKKQRSLQSKWSNVTSKKHKTSNKCLLINLWKWIKGNTYW